MRVIAKREKDQDSVRLMGEATPLLPKSTHSADIFDDTSKSGDVLLSCANLAACAFGASMLSLPLVLKITGAFWGVLLIGGTGILAILSAQVLSDAGRTVNKDSYKDVAGALLGRQGAAIAGILVSFSLYFAAVSYIVGASEVAPRMFSVLQSVPRAALMAAIVGVEFFAVLVSNLSVFGYASGIACIGCYIQAFVLVVKFFTTSDKLHLPGSLGSLSAFSLEGFLLSLPLASFVFAYHYIYLDIIEELEQNTQSNTWRINRLTLLILWSCYLPFTICSYALVKHTTLGPNVLTSLDGSWTVFVARFSLVALLILTFPLLAIPLRKRVEKVLVPYLSNLSTFQQGICSSAVLNTVIFATALTFTDLGVANTIAGGCLAIIMFIFPGLFLVVSEEAKSSEQGNTTKNRIFGWFLIAFGVITAFMGLFGSYLFPLK